MGNKSSNLKTTTVKEENKKCEHCTNKFSIHRLKVVCQQCFEACNHCRLSLSQAREAEGKVIELQNEIRVLKKLLKESFIA